MAGRTVISEENVPTLWGLSPQQLHDRFWAARGVQVVRQAEPSEVVEGAELFLLTDPRILIRFPLFELVETLSWVRPELLVLRVQDTRDRGYREDVVSDEEGRFVTIRRTYGGPDSRMARVALTPDPDIARRWQNAESTRDGWRMLRRRVPRSLQTTRKVKGYLYDGTVPREAMDCLRDLIGRWASPDSTIRRVRKVRGGVWADNTALVDRESRIVGNMWIGAGRTLGGDETVIGPSILWDNPLNRPKPGEVKWVEVEPRRVLDDPPRVSRPGLFRRTVKRLFDVVFSILVLALTLPLYPFIALAILLEDGWPVFFTHRRETLGGREFPCIKFRSMRKDADRIKEQLADRNMADGPQFYMEDDPRLTKVGRFLRNSQLDEIPQFINVLLGHMSVVGPRPSPRSENQFCPGWREGRLSVRPGITGLWQVKRTRQRGLDFQEWIRFDLEYVERSSLFLDLWIIWQTVLLLVRGKESG